MHSLPSLADCELVSFALVQPGNLVLQVMEPGGRTVSVDFRNVSFLKMVSSRARNRPDNEVWRLEEVGDSPLVRGIYEKDGVHWLQQAFGVNYQRTSSVEAPDTLRHVVLLTDYLDAEFLCTEYVIK